MLGRGCPGRWRAVGGRNHDALEWEITGPTWINCRAWAPIAATTAGFEYPRLATPKEAPQSMYPIPSPNPKGSLPRHGRFRSRVGESRQTQRGRRTQGSRDHRSPPRQRVRDRVGSSRRADDDPRDPVSRGLFRGQQFLFIRPWASARHDPKLSGVTCRTSVSMFVGSFSSPGTFVSNTRARARSATADWAARRSASTFTISPDAVIAGGETTGT